jgi:flavin-dependent thymidylate synthase
MKVTLVNFTPHALATLVFTKSTRLRMSGRALEEIIAWPIEKLMEEWVYMQNTIKSSWEFVDYIFTIEGVTRAFTHQLVRHRVGTSFAQQAQRVVNMSDFEYVATGTIRDADATSMLPGIYERTMEQINDGYQTLIGCGANPQDARGVLPTNVCTNICFKANLRTLNGMCGERLCVKAQGEFQDVMRAIRDAVIAVHPWAEPALRVACAQHGVCAFPSYQGCPIKSGVFNPETGLRYDEATEPSEDNRHDLVDIRPLAKDEIQALWLVNRAEAQPLAPAEDRK